MKGSVEDWIQCDLCDRWFHNIILCTDIDPDLRGTGTANLELFLLLATQY